MNRFLERHLQLQLSHFIAPKGNSILICSLSWKDDRNKRREKKYHAPSLSSNNYKPWSLSFYYVIIFYRPLSQQTLRPALYTFIRHFVPASHHSSVAHFSGPTLICYSVSPSLHPSVPPSLRHSNHSLQRLAVHSIIRSSRPSSSRYCATAFLLFSVHPSLRPSTAPTLHSSGSQSHRFFVCLALRLSVSPSICFSVFYSFNSPFICQCFHSALYFFAAFYFVVSSITLKFLFPLLPRRLSNFSLWFTIRS